MCEAGRCVKIDVLRLARLRLHKFVHFVVLSSGLYFTIYDKIGQVHVGIF